jgi:carboxymethylenebutenolidase
MYSLYYPFYALFYMPQFLSADNAGIITKTVAYDQDRKKRSGFLARPKDNRQHPALILIHEWWGLNENIKENARQFAKAGYVALAVDLYAGRVATTRDEARTLAGGVRGDMSQAFENLKLAVKFLKEPSEYVRPERIASVAGVSVAGGLIRW